MNVEAHFLTVKHDSLNCYLMLVENVMS